MNALVPPVQGMDATQVPNYGATMPGSTLALILVTSFTLGFSVITLALLFMRKLRPKRHPYSNPYGSGSLVASAAIQSPVVAPTPNDYARAGVISELNYSLSIGALRRGSISCFSPVGIRLPFGNSEGSPASELAMVYTCFFSLLYGDHTLHMSYLERLDRQLSAWMNTMVTPRREWAASHIDTICNGEGGVSFQTRCRYFEELWSSYSDWVLTGGKASPSDYSDGSRVTIHHL